MKVPAFFGALLLLAFSACDAKGPLIHGRFRESRSAGTVEIAVPPERSERGRATGPTKTHTFREAKHVLSRFYETHPATTLYSGCPLVFGRPDWAHCCLRREDTRRAAIEWEHVVPASAFGGGLPEWREGHPRCEKRGRPFRGRKCARRVSARFQAMEGDMHNLFPELGDVNGARGDVPMGVVGRATARHAELSECGLRFGEHEVEPRPEVRGDVARAYLYMSDVYPDAVSLTDDARAAFERWHMADPPDAIERERNMRIHREQGNENPWIQ